MKVAILSDTHLRESQKLPVQVQNIIDHVDLVVHAGDLTSEQPFAGLNGRFMAVRGNCDRGLALPEALTIQCQDVKIGLVHGYQFNSTDHLCTAFAQDVSVLVFGHTHVPMKKRIDDRVLFNPGSPTQRRFQPRCSLGLLYVDGADFDLEHIYFD
jgi:putative phosphoesterase